MKTTFTQRNGSALSVHPDGTADIDGVGIDNEAIGNFIRQLAVEEMEEEFQQVQKPYNCCIETIEEIAKASGGKDIKVGPNTCYSAKHKRFYRC